MALDRTAIATTINGNDKLIDQMTEEVKTLAEVRVNDDSVAVSPYESQLTQGLAYLTNARSYLVALLGEIELQDLAEA